MIRTLWFRPAEGTPYTRAVASYGEARALAGCAVRGTASPSGAPSFGRATLAAIAVRPEREELVVDTLLAGGWETVCPHCSLGTLDRRWDEGVGAYRLDERCERCEALAEDDARAAADDETWALIASAGAMS